MTMPPAVGKHRSLIPNSLRGTLTLGDRLASCWCVCQRTNDFLEWPASQSHLGWMPECDLGHRSELWEERKEESIHVWCLRLSKKVFWGMRGLSGKKFKRCPQAAGESEDQTEVHCLHLESLTGRSQHWGEPQKNPQRPVKGDNVNCYLA